MTHLPHFSFFTLVIFFIVSSLPDTSHCLYRTKLPQSTVYNSLVATFTNKNQSSAVIWDAFHARGILDGSCHVASSAKDSASLLRVNLENGGDHTHRHPFATFSDFFSTDAQHYLFANQKIGVCVTDTDATFEGGHNDSTPKQDDLRVSHQGSLIRNDILVFKVLMYPNHYEYWGSYLPLARIINATFLHGNDYYFIAHDSKDVHLYVRASLSSRGKDLAALLHEEALRDFGTYLEHPRDEFREIWKKQLNMRAYEPNLEVYDNGNGMVLLFHDTRVTGWNLRDFIQHTQDDSTIHRVKFSTEHSIRRVAMRKYPLERNEQIEEVFLLTDKDLHFAEWDTSAGTFNSVPIQFNEDISLNDIVDIQMNENRDCHDAFIYPDDKFRCPCVESRAKRFIIQGAKYLYYVSYDKVDVQSERAVQLTLLQKISLPLHCVGKGRVLSRSKDDMLIVIGCSNYVNMYLFDGEKYNWMENDHADDGDDAIHNFRSYYLTIAYEGTKWNQYRVPGDLVRKCDPRSRISSFFLPPAPAFPLNNDTPHTVINFDEYNTEVYGLMATRTLTVLGTLCVFVLVALSYELLNSLDRKLWQYNLIQIIYRVLSSRALFYIACTGMFLFSTFEIIMESDFINDWPAHLHHIERFMGGELNYENYMHHHGPCTYAGGFMWLYSLYQFITQGNLQNFQFLWALLELVHWQVMRSILHAASLPPVLALFAVFSNRLHLYNVRVVINDFPSLVMMHIVILLLLRHRWLLASVLYSFVVSTKLNFVFYSPAIFVVLLRHVGFVKTVGYCALMGLLQLVIGVPFIASNYLSYFSIAYDIRRTLLWEKTKNFKFLGRLLFQEWRVSILLLGLSITCVCALLLLVYVQGMKLTSSRHPTSQSTVLFLLLTCNFFFICFARGFYTPFLCWYLYTLPLMMYLSGTPSTLIVAFFSVHEVLVRNWGSMEAEMWVTLVLFLTNLMIVKDIFVCACQSARESISKRIKAE
eukprot:CAMPEP_0117448628 /NCGR_PEP_ID=MMETSP0759-20121206/7505_1 /TAXON_ID=63605 /ORGANISM="Percolomonas cosmopolitus, Strain WS" /LENGTH=980 /DNA_ID=CAMNT_0005241033 /DNA_START=20 /DNA_END=2963 /DNA_ORIENTATION=+